MLPQAQDAWIDFLNNLQAVFLLACYWTLTTITIPDLGVSNTEEKARESTSLPLLLSYAMWAILVFQLADLFVSHSLSLSARFWFQLLSGMAVGVTMALLVGCLESEFLSVPGARVFTACLYGYAVLQLAYLGFNSPSGASPIQEFLQRFATITSLPLKLLLIGFCYWAVQDGRLAFYMEKTRALIKDVPKQWEDFRAN